MIINLIEMTTAVALAQAAMIGLNAARITVSAGDEAPSATMNHLNDIIALLNYIEMKNLIPKANVESVSGQIKATNTCIVVARMGLKEGSDAKAVDEALDGAVRILRGLISGKELEASAEGKKA